jgi:glutathione reductase (NADPH)
MERQYDVVVIGTGSGASVVASRCRAAGWTVAILDARPFGGTCALRGCHPKKMLVSAGKAIDAVHRMTGKGIRAREVVIDWAALMRFKRTDPAPAPAFFEHNFVQADVVGRCVAV